MALSDENVPQTLDEALDEIDRLREALRGDDEPEPFPAGTGAAGDLLPLWTEQLLEHSQNMMFLFDERQRLVSCSAACAPLLANTSRAALVGAPFDEVFGSEVDPTWVAKVHRQCLDVAESLEPFEYEDIVEYSVDDALCVQLSIFPVVDEDTLCRGTIMTLNDSTELKRARERAEETQRSTEGMLASLSHDTRTPLNAIKGLAGLLALSGLNELQRSYVNNIIASANSITGVIGDVLDYGKAEAGGFALNEARYNVTELLAEVSNMVGLRAEDKGLLLLVDADPAMPTALWGDEVHLKQVITNLLANAIENTTEGTVQLALAADNQPGETVLVCTVEDSGAGIPASRLPGLFDAGQADADAAPMAGTGHGLATSRQLIEAMGGEITAASVYGQGSIFTVRVPQRVLDTQPLARLENPGARVLLVGDSPQMQNIAHKLDALNAWHRLLPEGAAPGEGEPYTHCIYEGDAARPAIRALRRELPGCLFATLRDMRGAFTAPEMQDIILFTPLLLTELARYLARNAAEAPPAQVQVAGAPQGELMVRNTLLLVVDDNEVNLMVASEMLRSFGAQVAGADSGAEALRMCGEQKYDLIFMDHLMPGMDGVEVTARLRSDPGSNQQTPIVALTANVADDLQSYYVRCGMDDFLAKPVEFAELSQTLRRWLPPEKIVAG